MIFEVQDFSCRIFCGVCRLLAAGGYVVYGVARFLYLLSGISVHQMYCKDAEWFISTIYLFTEDVLSMMFHVNAAYSIECFQSCCVETLVVFVEYFVSQHTDIRWMQCCKCSDCFRRTCMQMLCSLLLSRRVCAGGACWPVILHHLSGK